MKTGKIVAGILLLPCLVVAQSSSHQDVWEPLKHFAGSWEGTGKG